MSLSKAQSLTLQSIRQYPGSGVPPDMTEKVLPGTLIGKQRWGNGNV